MGRVSSNELRELIDIKTSLAELQGSLNTLHAEMRSGDKESTAAVKLLAQIVESHTHSIDDYRVDLKNTTKELRDGIADIRQHASHELSIVRVDLEAQLLEHEQASSPHDTTIGVRIERLEHQAIKERVIVSIITFIGWGGIAAIIKFLGN